MALRRMFSGPWRVQFLLVLLSSRAVPHATFGWAPQSLFLTAKSSTSRATRVVQLLAKRNRKRQDQDDLDRWYEDVDDNASPEDVFWQEMERQRLMNQLPGDNNNDNNINNPPVEAPEGTRLLGSATTMYANAVKTAAGNSMGRMAGMGGMPGSSGRTMMDEAADGTPVMDRKAAEATLQEFTAFSVKENWLDDDLVALMEGMKDDDNTLNDDGIPLEDQLKEWEQQDDDNTFSWVQNDEPWDHWGDEQNMDPDEEANDEIKSRLQELIGDDSEYSLEENEEDKEKAEEEFQQRIKGVTIQSTRLEKARNSPVAKDYFTSLEPNAIEGYDQMWVSAIDNACFNNLMGTFRNYGVQFADNFGDWQDGRVEDCIEYTIEDIASYKARQVYEVTGLPCIASRTSFEIEPIPPKQQQYGRPDDNPRVSSGYRFNDIGSHVDYMCEALKLFSEPTRVTRFRSCLCYYDGDMELFDYGVADVDIYFANSMRTFIPMAQAINEIMKKLQLTFGLEYQKWLRQRVDDALGAYGKASLKLRDRVLKEAKVLPNDIIDVSAFMDSKVDVNLMDDCAQELSKRFVDLRPSKILTVATTGLVIALPMAKYLQVPVVYARKERSVVMANTFQAGYSSKTVGKNRELLVSADHIDEGERILIVDDFLSSGASQEALLRIVLEAGAEAVGVGVLLEKVYDSGRQSLSGFGIPVQSLCRVASVKEGVIQLVEEDGYEQM
ncbi:Xanthine phosphoribosyltransferase [Seminavis robusta]|uniref:Xanthine phosphoribosyltransferase n=1 Tax=Seminavis robusta TaxID=568900 RepID=A0A9N8DVD0_9STRA|nr:Xanthine phosphoribosyltransferase [Seminavis robusta]|eukprot:Sro310_g114120.1 Xanthine phosphoribosyltransferase (723) ;mRNA; r:47411-49672